jgi:hypothetical protein
MRKNIDIPEEIVKDLKKMAIDSDKCPKCGAVEVDAMTHEEFKA